MIQTVALWLALLCGAAVAQPYGGHRTLVIRASSFPASLNPVVDPEVIKVYVLGFADRPVDAFDPDKHLECLLCTRVPSLANGDAAMEGAGMRVTLHFKPGLTWGDGAPLGAADLAFTARVGRDPKSGFANTRTWQKVTAVDVPDPLTAVVHLSEPTYDFDQWGEMLPAHLEAPVFEAATEPGSYIQHSLYNREPLNPGLYNGPYRITAIETGSQIVLERNEHWTGARPYFDRLVIRTIGNTAALQANLLSGDVDMVPGDGAGLTLDQVLSLQAQHPDQFAYAYKPNLGYSHIDVQLDNPVLADVRVRRALLMGIDRATLVAKTMGGRVPIADSFVNPSEPQYTPDVPTYPYDPARAKALLAEAGWTPGADGICRNAKGDRLSFELSTTSGVRVRELQQQVIQSGWRAICVDTTLKNELPRALFGETLKHRSFTGMVMFAWSSSVEGSPRQVLSSGQIPSADNGWGGGDYTDFHDAKMDADIDALERELDFAKRKPLWADIQRIYAEQLPVLPLFFGSDAHVWPRWLHGVVPTGHNAPTSLAVEGWSAE